MTISGVLVLLGSLAIAGCGSSEPSEYTFEDFESGMANALCTHSVECGEFSTLQSCLDSRVISFKQLRADIEAGLVVMDYDKSRQCFAESRDAICADESADSCKDTIGQVPLNGQCTRNYVCAGDAFCQGYDSASCTLGTCTVLSGIGDSCTSSDCSGNLSCGFFSEVCQELSLENESCDGTGCASGYVCNDPSSGVCVARPRTGESCDILPCYRNDDFCDASETCAPRVTVGQLCTEYGDECVEHASCVAGYCEARPSRGEACTYGGPDCLGYTFCEEGVCTLRDASVTICTL